MSVRRPKIVVLGMMSKMPVAGVVWQNVHYLVGLERLGYEVYYVEAHARTPSIFMEHEHDDGSGKAAAFIARVMERFGFGRSWAYHALHDAGRCYGMTDGGLRRLYRNADLLINLHGGTVADDEMAATGRLIYVETDPVQVQLELDRGGREAIDYLEPHCAFFTFAENYGRPDCPLPVSDRFEFKPTRQPVALDFWPDSQPGGRLFTTIGQWRQDWRDVQFNGEVYRWSKHHEFLKFLRLPERTGVSFELALGNVSDDDRQLLEQHGWRVRPAEPLSDGIDAYRDFIGSSRAEFTVAKDQNVRLNTGWSSDRSATYLAAGRPVVTQETGFSKVLPSGEGLFGFATLEEAAAAVEAIEADWKRHSRAAREIAREHFDAVKVLARLLDEVGLDSLRARPALTRAAFPAELDLAPVRRSPTTLAEATARRVLERPLPAAPRLPAGHPAIGIVVVMLDNLVFNRLCLETLLADPDNADTEVVVVDNGSTDGTRTYLRALAAADTRVRLVFNERNVGFAAATNQGLAASRAPTLVMLNNDAIAPPGALRHLVVLLRDPAIGLVGPVTNRSGDEAEIEAPYTTFGGLIAFADERARAAAGLRDVRSLTLFCAACRRETYEQIGPLDTQFGPGMFEDDDYVIRVRHAGYRVVCADNVFVHHFGQASLGRLAAEGTYGDLFHENRRRFEEKWGFEWTPHERRANAAYDELVECVRRLVRESVPDGAQVLVVSKGDDDLLRLNGVRAAHFPRDERGWYAGYHPRDDAEAIALLQKERRRGAEFLVFPQTSRWWLEHYAGLRHHLEDRYRAVADNPSCLIFALAGRPEEGS